MSRALAAAASVSLALLGPVVGALVLGARPASAGAPDATIRVLTYNVAGLPLGLSGSNPEVNSALISPRLNDFDLVVVQEDFGFHDDLTSAIEHPHVTAKDTRDTDLVLQIAKDAGLDPPELGDGLNTFSRSPFAGFTRITWNDCFGEFDNGSDCLALKGFSVARHEIAPGAFVDVYDLHADAGGDEGSLAARRANLRQLADFIVANSDGQALIVLGDTNSRYTREGDILPEFTGAIGVSDLWIELVRQGSVPSIGPSLKTCDDFGSADCERVDKIFYRSNDAVTLTAIGHEVPSDWIDPLGKQLSDHEPLVAEFEVTLVPEPSLAALSTACLVSLAALARRRRHPAPDASLFPWEGNSLHDLLIIERKIWRSDQWPRNVPARPNVQPRGRPRRRRRRR